MPLSNGSKLGPYEVVSPLGAGGMGEVYRARDSRLGRSVAIKLLPEKFAEDSDRVARFEREARAASALSHANVVAVYDIGREGKNTYIVTEIVEGGTLRDLLEHGPVPLKRALDLSAQIASGLSAAHEQGIVHRDLKPENILLTKSGEPKIADFGLAKLTETSEGVDSQLPTRDDMNTSEGVIMGTVAYMSPEQASARKLDFRSDQFAFGSILYEMLTGRPAFRRGTSAETLSAIIRDEPESLASTASKLPAPVIWVVERCLAKEPGERYASTRDLAHDLTRLRSAPSSSMSGSTSPAPVDDRKLNRLRIMTGAALLATAAAVFFGLRPAPAPPFYQQLTFRRGEVDRARFAPDGQTVLYSASWEGKDSQIYLTRTNDRDSTPLALPTAALEAISPSGKVAIGMGADGRTLAETSLAAGAPRPLAEGVPFADYQPGSEKLAISKRRTIEFPIGTVIYDSGPGSFIRNVLFSPKGDQIAFLENRSGTASVVVIDLKGHRTVLISGWSDIVGMAWNPKQNEIWFTARESPKAGVLALHAVSLSGRERLVASAPGILVVKDIDRDGRVLMARQDWGFSAMFRSADGGPERDLSWYGFSIPKSLSPDGKTMLFDEDDVVYVRSTDGVSPALRLGDGVAQDLSPDGKWALALPVTSHDHILLLPTGPGESKSLGIGDMNCNVAIWFPDSQRILFEGDKREGRRGLYSLPVSGGTPRALAPEGVGIAGPISPDGKLVAGWTPDKVLTLYSVDGSSTAPRAVPGMGPRDNPLRWDSTGRFIFVQEGKKTFRLELSTGRKELAPGIELTDSADGGEADSTSVVLTPDGRYCAYSRFHSTSVLYLVTGLR